MAVKGYVMNIQPFSVNDGDGIRTTIFMAGCPLACKWCSNPEGLSCNEKVGWYSRKCIGCGACAKVCPEDIGIDMNGLPGGEPDGSPCTTMTEPDRVRCTACGRCVDVCPTGARARMVTLTDADDVIRQVQKHRLFYSYSGGGVTFSGGEATLQTEFLDYLSSQIYDLGYSMAIETCGMFQWERVAHILGRMDLIFIDLKMMDPDEHQRWTGASNGAILDNIKNLARLGESTDVVVRVPVIGGVNDNEDNIQASASFVHRHLPSARMELLPYHSLGRIKYEALGESYDHPEFHTPDAEEMNRLRAVVSDAGVELADFR